MRLLVLVLGAGGQLGEAMIDGLGGQHEVIARSRAEVNLTAARAVRDVITSTCPDVIVNCAAYTDVDGAEKDPCEALAVNSWALQSMARAASDIDATLIHFSTDFVFDGDADRPYGETDPPNPRGTYAISKLLGEWFAAGLTRHYILRVESLFGGARAKSSVDRLLDGILAGRVVRAFSDRTVSPSYVEDVVSATRDILNLRPTPGIYHCVNGGWTTWLELARELALLAGKPDAAIEAVEMASVGLTTPRPKFAALSNEKLTAAHIEMPSWQDALARYVTLRLSPAEL